MKRSIPAREAMTVEVLTADPKENLSEAAELMAERGIGSLVAVEGNKPIGIITERDLLEKIVSKDLKPSQVKVEEIMSRPLITISPDTDLFEATQMMVNNDIRRLPVIEDDTLIGILCADDVVEVSPKLLEIIPEHEEIETTEEEVEESVCEICGELKKSVREYQRMWICDECRDFLGG